MLERFELQVHIEVWPVKVVPAQNPHVVDL